MVRQLQSILTSLVFADILELCADIAKVDVVVAEDIAQVAQGANLILTDDCCISIHRQVLRKRVSLKYFSADFADPQYASNRFRVSINYYIKCRLILLVVDENDIESPNMTKIGNHLSEV